MKRLSALLLALAMLLMLAACGSVSSASSGSEPSQSVQTEPTASEQTEAPAVSAAEIPDTDSAEEPSEVEEAPAVVQSPSLPYSTTGEELSMWLPLTPDLANTYSDLNEHIVVQAAEEVTGVHINFTHASFFTANDDFNLMTAAGDYCDLISCAVKYYATGGAGAMEDGVIINLSDLIPEYAPDYNAVINSDETHIAQSRSDTGDILAFYTWKDEVYNRSGMQTRGDWLDELGLDTPETYEEYESVLLAFQSAYGCTAAMQMYPSCLLTGSMLCGGYGVSGYYTVYDDSGEIPNVMFQIDGTAHCSLLEDGYRDYLTMLNKWYTKGLISSDFLSGSCNPNDSKNLGDIYSGNTGIWYSEYQNLADYASSIDDDNVYIAALKDPTIKKGDRTHFGGSIALGSSNGFTTSISTQCENTELATKWCNFWFTEQGFLLATYGIEGESYTLDASGNPVFTELVTNNPNGLSQREAQSMYSLSQFPTLSKKSVDFLSLNDEQIAAIEVWDSSIDGAYLMPDVSLTPEESAEYASIMSDINTYASTTVDQMVIGETSLADWDAFTDTLRGMKIERCVEIYQAALDRYNSR